MEIRYGTYKDLAALAAVERRCFPASEAATEEDLKHRLQQYPNHFWLLFDGGTLVSFVDGMVSDEKTLTDEMYEKAELHKENGAWQMIFGVNTLPEYRRRGCAGMLLRRVIADAEARGRKGVILTCKEELMPFYSKFGFRSEGISPSEHGGAVWYQMILELPLINGQR